MIKFIFGFFAGAVFTLLTMGTAQASGPAVTEQHHEDFQGGDEKDWDAAAPSEGKPEPKTIHPPRGTFGFFGCTHYAFWVFLADGKSYRYDDTHNPKTAKEMETLLKWIRTGPNDILELSCPTEL